VVLDGYYSAAAHEIGHTFGLYYGVPEQYEIANPGIFCTGFRADENEWRTGYDFMGLSPYQTTANMWVNRDTTFDPLFSGLKTAGDPQIIFVQGIIHQDDGVVTLVELPDTWYSMPYGIPDTVPEGDRFAIRFTLDDYTTVTTSFDTQFFVHIDPGIEVGENLPEDFSGFGDIPVNFAGFAFAVEYPEGTTKIEIVEKTPSGDQVIKTIEDPEGYVESVSPQFSGFLPPIKPDGSSSFKRRTIVPVKFQLQSAPGVFVTSAQAELWIAEMDDEGSIVVGDPVMAPSATPYDLFRYDALKNQYVFNLNTKEMSKGYWQLQVRFEDGTTETVRIRLK
jgi:hypothetical protein